MPPIPLASESEPWNWLLKTAQEEVRETIQHLPADLRPHAERLAVTYESWPSEDLRAEGWEEDLLGLYIGDPVDSPELSGAPRQIILYLENIWDWVESDADGFREEVRITYIHEFGHYLGLNEEELEERGLL